MASYSFQLLGVNEVGVTGADPFADPAYTTPAAVGSVLSLDPAAAWTGLTLEDDEGHLHDGDTAFQTLVSDIVVDGTTYPTGSHVETEYSYVVRLASSSDPGDNFNIYAISMDGVVVGFSADQPMQDGADYTIISQGSESPSVLYSDLIVCFAEGTLILTPAGARPIERLRPGDRVTTADDGPQSLVWAGVQEVCGVGRKAPIRVDSGVLGAARPLLLSPQHRVLAPDWPGDEALVPVKALIGRPGVTVMPHRRVRYYHLLFDRHQVIFANGAPAESLYPGPMALRALGGRTLDAIRALTPGLAPGGAPWRPARRLLRPRTYRDTTCPGQ